MAEKIDRLTRVNELLKREIANWMERGFLETPGMLVSVTEVRSSVDLRNASVGISIFGGDASARRRVFRQLNDRRPELQRVLARTLGFKHTPVLAFQSDERTAKGDRVLELLNRPEEALHDGE